MVFNKLRSSLKRGQSSGSTSNNETPPTTTPTRQASDSSATSSNLSWSAPRLPSWLRSSLSSSQRKKSILTPKDPEYKRLNKPFTPQNLEHQKLLSAFDWNLAENGCSRRRRQSQDAMSFISGISPCATPRTSIDYSGRREKHHSEKDEEKHRPLPPDDKCVASTTTIVTDVNSDRDTTMA